MRLGGWREEGEGGEGGRMEGEGGRDRGGRRGDEAGRREGERKEGGVRE